VTDQIQAYLDRSGPFSPNHLIGTERLDRHSNLHVKKISMQHARQSIQHNNVPQ
jgi:hypothetical protein